MMRTILCTLAAMLIWAGGAFAAEATVTKLDSTAGTLTFKIGDKEQTVELKSVKVLSAGGKEVDLAKAKFKDGTKIDVTEKDGKVTEIKLMKKKNDK